MPARLPRPFTTHGTRRSPLQSDGLHRRLRGWRDTADDDGADVDLVSGFAAGCLEDGCDFAAHAFEALEVCSAATGGADDTIVY